MPTDLNIDADDNAALLEGAQVLTSHLQAAAHREVNHTHVEMRTDRVLRSSRRRGRVMEAHLKPRAGGAAEVEHGGARRDELVLLLHLDQLQRRSNCSES